MDIEENLKGFTKKELNYLSRRKCAFCDMPLNKRGCGAIFEDCGIEVRNERRINCLKEYKPRKSKQQKFVEELFSRP